MHLIMPCVYYSAADQVLSSEAFAREVLRQHLGINGSMLKIVRNQYGKPFLNDHPDVHFNLSHTADAIVCAVSDRQVGIDMEKKRKVNLRVMNRLFTENERAFVLASDHNQDDRFTKVWIMKEAYVKYTGKGLHQAFDTFDVLNMPGITTFEHNGYNIAVCQDCAM